MFWTYNNDLTHYRGSNRSTSQGGYLCADGSGKKITFEVHHERPKLMKVTYERESDPEVVLLSAAGYSMSGGIDWGADLWLPSLGASGKSKQDSPAVLLHVQSLTGDGVVRILDCLLSPRQFDEPFSLPVEGTEGFVVLSCRKETRTADDSKAEEGEAANNEPPVAAPKGPASAPAHASAGAPKLDTQKLLTVMGAATVLGLLAGYMHGDATAMSLVTYVVTFCSLAAAACYSAGMINRQADEITADESTTGAAVAAKKTTASAASAAGAKKKEEEDAWVVQLIGWEPQPITGVAAKATPKPQPQQQPAEGGAASPARKSAKKKKKVVEPPVWETCKEHGRFVRAEKGDEESARKRWLKTMEWRKAEGIDTILCEPHPHFNIIKANYPHYYYGRSKTGNPLYVDKPGGIDLKILRENGITLDDLLRQLVFR
jgi:hypothetical protein